MVLRSTRNSITDSRSTGRLFMAPAAALLSLALLATCLTAATGDPAVSHPSAVDIISSARSAITAAQLPRRGLAPVCSNLANVFVSPNGSDTACCNTAGTACASLEAAVQKSASGAIISLLPGAHKLLPSSSLTGLQLGGLSLTITGDQLGAAAGAAPAVTLDCNGGGCLNATCLAASCASAVLTLSSFSVVNGKSKDTGGCVNVNGQSLTVSDMTFSSCSAPLFGGAIFVTTGNLTVRRISISASSSPGSLASSQLSSGGGAIAVVASPSADITGLTVSKSSSQFGAGGGLQLQYVDKARVQRARFVGCSAFLGGAIATASSDVALADVTMTNCKAVLGGGYADSSSTTVSLTSVSVTSCSAIQSLDPNLLSGGSSFGGGLFLNYTTSVTITRSTVTACSADYEGGGISLFSIASGAAIDSSKIDGCTSSSQGGGISANTVPTFSLTNSTVSNNQLLATFAPYGAGLYVVDSASKVAGSVFAGNGAYGQNGPSDGVLGEGGGIYFSINMLSTVVYSVQGCTFRDNQAENGAAIVSVAGLLSVTNSLFLRNSQAQYGGAMNIRSSAELSNCTFDRNSAVSSGGALYYGASASDYIAVTNCRFVNNEAEAADGGAVWVVQAPTNLTITSSSFLSNRATASRGGAIFTGGSLVTVISSTFTNNTAFLKGGAVAVIGSQQLSTGSSALAVFGACNFTRNYSPLGGGAVYAGLTSSTSLDSCFLTDNSAPSGAAVMVQEMAQVEFTGTTCGSNRANTSGGCIAASDMAQVIATSSILSANSAGSQGAAAWVSGQASLALSSCTVSTNQAPSGAALWTEMRGVVDAQDTSFVSNTARDEGGVFYATHNVRLSLSDCRFNRNTATRGGAFLLDAYSSLNATGTTFLANAATAMLARGNSTADFRSCTFSNNTSPVGTGGALWATDHAIVTASSCNLTSNVGREGGGLFSDVTSSVSLTRCTFSANQAQTGAGMAISGKGSISGTSLTFTGNKASSVGGGAAFLEQSHGTLTSSTFVSNEAVVGGSGIVVERSSTATQPLLPLTCSNLTFQNNTALYPEAVAFYEASYNPSDRIQCSGCTKEASSQTFGSIPAGFYLKWPGSTVSSANWTASSTFVVVGAVDSPVSDLQVVVVDSYGNTVQQDNTSLATIQADPRISGLLRATAVNGIATIPPINVYVTPDQAQIPIALQLTLTSPVAAYPAIVKTFNISFCAAGMYFNATTYQCMDCPVGSWCASGQPSQPCDDGSFTFYTNAVDSSACIACDDGNLDCSGGVLTVAMQAWLDLQSVNSTPTTYSCIVTNGCNGYEYTGPEVQQCLPGYDEDVPMCSLCLDNYFSSLGFCAYCPSFLTTLFPLFLILVCMVWVGFFVLTNWYTTFDIFLTEVQYLTIIGSFNLNPPAAWVYRLLNIYNLAVFDPDVVGPNCVMDYNFVAAYITGFIITFAGLAVYLLRYIAYRVWEHQNTVKAMVTCTGPMDEVAAAERSSREREDRMDFMASLLQGTLSWLDICYLSILLRILPVFQSQQVGDTTVLAFAPSIEWFSPTHLALFIPSVIVMVLFIGGLPLFYAWVLFSARYHKTLHTEEFEKTFGFLTEGYTRKYYWWHLTSMTLRLVYSFLSIFLYQYAQVQISIVAVIQVVRIAMEYKMQPYEEGSHVFLLATLNVGSLFFTLGLLTYNYVNQEAFSEFCFAMNVILMFGPALVFIAYDVANRRLEQFNAAVLEIVWEAERHRHEKELADLDVVQIIDLNEVGQWFRPYALFLFLRRRRNFEFLLQVRNRYQRCVIDGLGSVEWVDQLKKPQQYAGLSQILLGSRKGYIPIARLPANSVFCVQHNAWHEHGICPDDGPMAPGRARSFNRRRARLRTTSMSGLKGEAEHGAAGAAVGASSAAGESEGKEGKAGKKVKSIQIAERNWPPKLERRIQWSASGTGEGPAAGAAGSTAPATSSIPARPSTAGGIVGATAAVGGVVAGQSAPAARPSTAGGVLGTSATPPRSAAVPRADTLDAVTEGGARMPRSTSVDGTNTPSNEGFSTPPDRTPVMSRAGSRRGSLGASRSYHDYGEGEYVEASLDMAELTFAFQQNLALLVKSEKKRKAQKAALRHVVQSKAIYQILSWLTSETSTPDDQRLLGELIRSVRSSQQTTAKAIGWLNGLQSFYAGTSNLSKALEEEIALLRKEEGPAEENNKDK